MEHNHNQCNIALIGYGKMGQLIEQIATDQGHTVVATFNRNKKISSNALEQADVCIDFSHPECALSNIEYVAREGKNLVMGTTGWYDHLDRVKKIVEKYQIGFLYAPNFSIGVHLFLKVVENAAHLIDAFDEYDIMATEAHHNQKADSPSGTAKALGEILLQHIKRKKTIVHDSLDRPIAPDELHFPSIRCGSIPGTHSVTFDSRCDTISLKHTARNREGFARGAIAAAEWLKGKIGVYTLDQMISD